MRGDHSGQEEGGRSTGIQWKGLGCSQGLRSEINNMQNGVRGCTN